MPRPTSKRSWSRFSSFRDLSVSYEGRGEALAIRPTDLSPTGMFINTAEHFPEGAILNVSFRLTHSDHRISVRSEVRYCLRGVGVGVEFIGISREDQNAIREEIETPVTVPVQRKR